MFGLRSQGDAMKNPPTTAELASELEELAEDMLIASQRMAYVAGFDPLFAKHAKELAGAAKLVAEWSRSIARRKQNKCAGRTT